MSKKLRRAVFVLSLLITHCSLLTCTAQAAQGWTFLQDGVMTSCNAGSSTCTFQGNNVLPTTAGSVMIVRIHTQNNVTIKSVCTGSNCTGMGPGWTLCPAGSCHVPDTAFNDNQDLAYNLSGTGGATSFTVTLSAPASGFFGGNFMEFMPPSGATPSFDAAGTAASSTCNPCTGVGLTLTATDLVVQVLSGNGGKGSNAWHAFSAPYMTDYTSNGINLNATSGAAPTVTLPSAGADFSAIAFKTSLGSYTPPALPMSIVSYTQVLGPNCGPTCTFTVPTTGTGHLLFVEAADLNGTFISSVSGAGTSWVVPTGSNSCRINTGGNALSCAYELSDTSGASSLSVTMNGSGSTYFAVYEIANTAGAFSLDTQGSGTDPGTPALTEKGIALTLTGSNDAIIQNAFIPGGTNVVSLYPQPLNSNGQGINFFSNSSNGSAEAQSAILLNTQNGTAPFWINGGGTNNVTTLVTGIAFSGGTTTPPPSPCDVNGDGVTNVADVQMEVNMALGINPCTNPSGTCSVLSVQRVVNAALGGQCATP